jgi:hypothetical protein
MTAGFWSEVDRSAGPDGCWPHQRCRTATVTLDGRRQRPRRCAYEIATGTRLARSQQIIAECGLETCCNPTHRKAITKAEVQHRRNQPNRNNTHSGIRNVYKDRDRWAVSIGHQGHTIHVGRYDDIAEADAAAQRARAQLTSKAA